MACLPSCRAEHSVWCVNIASSVHGVTGIRIWGGAACEAPAAEDQTHTPSIHHWLLPLVCRGPCDSISNMAVPLQQGCAGSTCSCGRGRCDTVGGSDSSSPAAAAAVHVDAAERCGAAGGDAIHLECQQQGKCQIHTSAGGQPSGLATSQVSRAVGSRGESCSKSGGGRNAGVHSSLTANMLGRGVGLLISIHHHCPH